MCSLAGVPANPRITVNMLPATPVTSMCSHARHFPVFVELSQIVAIILEQNSAELCHRGSSVPYRHLGVQGGLHVVGNSEQTAVAVERTGITGGLSQAVAAARRR